jgi:cytochrome P450
MLDIGELTFSENLNMLHDTKYSPWVENIFASIKLATQFRSIRQWHSSTQYLMDEVMAKTKTAERQMREHQRYTNERVDRRLQREPDQPDIWSKILAKDGQVGGLSLDEQYSNASLFMMAGAETTATALAGTTYYLLRNPRCLAKLTEEIRSEFKTLSEVTMERASRLKYLNAVLSESMRRYPPLPITLLRTIPKGGMTICDQYVPENVNVGINHFAVSHLEMHFKRPYEFIPERWLGDPEFKHDHLDAAEVG